MSILFFPVWTNANSITGIYKIKTKQSNIFLAQQTGRINSPIVETRNSRENLLKFELEFAERGNCYFIKVKGERNQTFYLELQNTRKSEYVQVWSNRKTGRDAQKFIFVKDRLCDNCYRIRPKANQRKYLTNLNKKVVTYRYNGQKNQVFELIKQSPLSKAPRDFLRGGYKLPRIDIKNPSGYSNQAAARIEPKEFYISPKGSNLNLGGNSLGKQASLILQTKAQDPRQRFRFEDAGRGYYFIRNVKSGLYVDVQWGKGEPGTPIWFWPLNRGNAQKFKAVAVKGGYYKFYSAIDPTLCLSVQANSRRPGRKIQLDKESANDAQLFKLNVFQVTGIFNPPPRTGYITDELKEGTYFIKPLNKDKFLESGEAQTILLQNKRYTPTQMFNIKKTKDGYFQIENYFTKKRLDVRNARRTPGTEVWQYEPNTTLAQKFKIFGGNNKFKISSALDRNMCVGLKRNGRLELTRLSGQNTNILFHFEKVNEVCYEPSVAMDCSGGDCELYGDIHAGIAFDAIGGQRLITFNGGLFQLSREKIAGISNSKTRLDPRANPYMRLCYNIQISEKDGGGVGLFDVDADDVYNRDPAHRGYFSFEKKRHAVTLRDQDGDVPVTFRFNTNERGCSSKRFTPIYGMPSKSSGGGRKYIWKQCWSMTQKKWFPCLGLETW